MDPPKNDGVDSMSFLETSWRDFQVPFAVSFSGGKYQINHRGLGPRFTFPFLFWVGGKMILAKRWIDLSGPIFFK